MIEMTDESKNGVLICRMQGRLDGATSAVADQHLTSLADQPNTIGIVLDLSKLDYMSSAGLRVLLKAAKRAKSGSSRLVLAAPQAGVKQVLEISGFTSILDIHSTCQEAVGIFSS